MEAPNPSRTTQIALLFEGGLGAAALGLGWLLGHWPLVGIDTRGENAADQLVGAAWGLVATGPLLVALLLIDTIPIGPLRRLRDLTTHVIMQMFGGASVAQLAAVAVAAGLGEEMLFRGLVQSGLSRLIPAPFGIWIALAVASVLFGLCHWLNATYAFLAVLAGAYFGLIFLLTGSLWTPVIAHAAYDLIALVYLIRPKRLIR